jgi:hypothetical protein
MPTLNHTTVARVFDEAMQTVWPDGEKIDNVRVVSYECHTTHEKSSRGLPMICPKLIHVSG